MSDRLQPLQSLDCELPQCRDLILDFLNSQLNIQGVAPGTPYVLINAWIVNAWVDSGINLTQNMCIIRSSNKERDLGTCNL